MGISAADESLLPLVREDGGEAKPTSPTTPCPHRVVQLDLIKAISIVLVVLEHSMRSLLLVKDATWWECYVGEASSACTPAFLYVSGFLGHQQLARSRKVFPLCADTFPTVLRILARLIVPYAVSCTVYLSVDAVSSSTEASFAEAGLTGLRKIITFDVRGIHYYVVLVVSCSLLLPVVAWGCTKIRAAVGVLLLLLLLRVCTPPLLEAAGVSIWWQLRLPTFGLGFYALGYATGAHAYHPIHTMTPRMRRLISAALATGCVAWLVSMGYAFHSATSPTTPASHMTVGRELGKVLGICACALLFTLAAPQAVCNHPLVRYLADASYTIYLYHLLAMEHHVVQLHAVAYPTDDQPAWFLLNAGPQFGPHRALERALLGLGSSMGLALVAVAVLGPDWAERLFGARLPFDPCGQRARERTARDRASLLH